MKRKEPLLGLSTAAMSYAGIGDDDAQNILLFLQTVSAPLLEFSAGPAREAQIRGQESLFLQLLDDLEGHALGEDARDRAGLIRLHAPAFFLVSFLRTAGGM
jgi:hypothetical protein